LKIYFSVGIAGLIHRLPSRQILSRTEAQKFAATPKEVEVDFPFGSFTHSFTPPLSSPTPQPGPSKRQRGDTCDEPNLQPPEKKQA